MLCEHVHRSEDPPAGLTSLECQAFPGRKRPGLLPRLFQLDVKIVFIREGFHCRRCSTPLSVDA